MGIEYVDFHFDVMCPWAYQTSRWIREVRDLNGLEVRWRFFSLEEINRVEGKKHPWEREWSYGWSMLRIAALLRRDEKLVDAWYERAGRALHEEGRQPHRPEVAEELLVEIGLDPGVVAEAIADPTTHDDVRADHERVVAARRLRRADAVLPRRPVPVRPGRRRPAPRRRRARAVGPRASRGPRFRHLYEIQRPKQRADQELIAETFRPYLTARNWNTIQNPTP